MDLRYGLLGFVILLTIATFVSAYFTARKYSSVIMPWLLYFLTVLDIVLWIVVAMFWLGYLGHDVFNLSFPAITK